MASGNGRGKAGSSNRRVDNLEKRIHYAFNSDMRRAHAIQSVRSRHRGVRGPDQNRAGCVPSRGVTYDVGISGPRTVRDTLSAAIAPALQTPGTTDRHPEPRSPTVFASISGRAIKQVWGGRRASAAPGGVGRRRHRVKVIGPTRCWGDRNALIEALGLDVVGVHGSRTMLAFGTRGGSRSSCWTARRRSYRRFNDPEDGG